MLLYLTVEYNNNLAAVEHSFRGINFLDEKEFKGLYELMYLTVLGCLVPGHLYQIVLEFLRCLFCYLSKSFC